LLIEVRKEMISKHIAFLLPVLVLSAGGDCFGQTLEGGIDKSEQADQERVRIMRPLDGSAQQTNLNGQASSDGPVKSQAEVPKLAPERFKQPLVGKDDFREPESKSLKQQATIEQFDEHGQRIVGVLGCKINNFTGTVQAVFPPSNLNRWGIHPGDRVLAYNNHRWRSGWNMVEEACQGPPGSIFQITIQHDGQVMSLEVPRVDSRLLVKYDSVLGSHHYQDCAAQTRFW
jgi:hypothetical protein